MRLLQNFHHAKIQLFNILDEDEIMHLHIPPCCTFPSVSIWWEKGDGGIMGLGGILGRSGWWIGEWNAGGGAHCRFRSAEVHDAATGEGGRKAGPASASSGRPGLTPSASSIAPRAPMATQRERQTVEGAT